MEQPAFHNEDDGTRRRIQPSSPAEVSDKDALPESTPKWDSSEWFTMRIVLTFFLAALADIAIATCLVPSWGWFIFEWAALIVPVCVVFYKLCERLVTYEPPPCML
ncbi:hypothetical protein MRX96_000560 [Rhipicephalus microplus]